MKKSSIFMTGMLAILLAFGFIVSGCDNGTAGDDDDDDAVHFSSGMIGTWEKPGYYDENDVFIDTPLVIKLAYSKNGDTLFHPRLTSEGTDITATLIEYQGHIGISELYVMQISPGNTFSLHCNVDNNPPEIYLYAIDDESQFDDNGVSLFGGFYYKK
jgi:predicted transcriptional regulator